MNTVTLFLRDVTVYYESTLLQICPHITVLSISSTQPIGTTHHDRAYMT